MKELELILHKHGEMYPKMEPTDAVKLIYQQEFGGGHMIRNEKSCMEYLQAEYAQVPHDPRQDLYEAIGNDIIRVNLAALDRQKLESLGRAFLVSAREICGDHNRFLKKLEVLCKLTAENTFSFDTAALADYLKDYAAAGYPAVSHSPVYREHYRPAYRIILAKYLPLLDASPLG